MKRWQDSPDKRKHIDTIYGRVLRFLREQSPQEYSPGEIAAALDIDVASDRPALNLIGQACQKFMQQGLCNWNRMIRKRKYFVEERHFRDVDHRLKAYTEADDLEREGRERVEKNGSNATGFAFAQVQIKTPKGRQTRRW